MATKIVKSNSSIKEVATYYPDGTIQSVYFIKNEKKQGVMKKWDEQGRLIYEGCFNEGLQEGLHREFYANEQLYTEKNYKNSLLSGVSREWYCTGEIKSKERYVKGKLHGKQCYWTKEGKGTSVAVHQAAFM